MKTKRPTAGELMARLHADPAYRERIALAEAERASAIAAGRQAEAPVVRDLIAAGFAVDSIGDLVQRGLEYRAAVPVLVSWLSRVPDASARETIVRCLSVPFAKPAAARPLVDAFRREAHDGVRWAIGNALDVVADDSVLEDMIELARDRRYGKAREMVVVGLGCLDADRALPVLLELLEDDEVCGHAIVGLARARRPEVRPLVAPFVNHPKAWIRNEAKRLLRRLR